MTQQQLADVFEVTLITVPRWEILKEILNTKSIKKMADLLGMVAMYIF